MDFYQLLLIFTVIIFLGYFIKATTGFAGALFSVPLLALFFDIKFVVPVVSLIDMGSGFMLFPGAKPKIHKQELKRILAGLLLGTLLGIFFLRSFENQTLRIIFGVVVILFALKILFLASPGKGKLKPSVGVAAGFAGGVTGGMFSTSGPPMVAYLEHQLSDKTTLRATLITAFLVGSTWQNSLYAVVGILDREILIVALFMIPVLLVSSYLGTRFHPKINENFYRKAVGAILMVSGILLLV